MLLRTAEALFQKLYESSSTTVFGPNPAVTVSWYGIEDQVMVDLLADPRGIKISSSKRWYMGINFAVLVFECQSSYILQAVRAYSLSIAN